MTEDWRKALYKKQVVGVVFIDFKKLESTRRSLCGRRRRTAKQFWQEHLCSKENLPLGSLGQRSSPPLPAAEPSSKTGTGDLFQHCGSTIVRLTSDSRLLLDFVSNGYMPSSAVREDYLL